MVEQNSKLFSSYRISDRVIPNRLVAQPMEINSAASGGAVCDSVIKRYQELARGDWGIVFLEATSITDRHLARQNGLVLNAANLDGFKRLVEAFKVLNERTLLLIQLTHSGRQSGDFSRKVKAYTDQQEDVPILTANELSEIQERFAGAIRLAKEAGFDGVDVKACHGYLGGELLRPRNNRADQWGGSAENRSRFIAQLIRTAVEECPSFVVGSRVSLFEGIRGGCGTATEHDVIEDLSDMIEILIHFLDAGADYLNISSGIPVKTPQLTRPLRKGDFYRYSHFRYTKRIKEAFPQAVVIGSAYTTGNDSCLAYAHENVAKGYTDLVGFGRQNLADPLFPVKSRRGAEGINYCTLCGRCSDQLKNDRNIFCQTHNPVGNPYS